MITPAPKHSIHQLDRIYDLDHSAPLKKNTRQQLPKRIKPIIYILFLVLLQISLHPVCAQNPSPNPNSGPYNYDPQIVNSAARYNSVYFYRDGQHGWIAGDEGRILRTENGGIKWKESAPLAAGDDRPAGRLHRIYFSSELLGWVVGDNGLVFRTVDGGLTWKRASFVPGTDNLNSVYFEPNLKFGIIACDNATIWISQDSGKTWAANNRIFNQSEHRMLDAWISKDGKRIVVCGKFGSLVYSNDGGFQFKDFNISNPNFKPNREHIYRLQFSDNLDQGIATCEAGYVLTWKYPDTVWKSERLLNVNLVDLHARDPQQEAWAVTDKGLLFHRLQAGDPWKMIYQFPSSQAPFSGVSFAPDGINGWICGGSGILLTTHDAGNTWKEKKPSDEREYEITTLRGKLLSLRMDITGMDQEPGTGNFIACTREGYLYLSRDTCHSWQLAATIADTPTCVCYNFVDKRFYTGGREGRIFRLDPLPPGNKNIPVDSLQPVRVDDGKQTGVVIHQIAVSSKGTFIAIGDHGTALFRRDGYWEKNHHFDTVTDLLDIYISAKGDAWVTSSESKIYQWKQVEINSEVTLKTVPGNTQRFSAVRFSSNGSLGLVLSRSYNREPHLFISRNGGDWIQCKGMPPNEGLSAVQFGYKDQDILILSDGGDIFRSVDQGASWMPVRPRAVSKALNIIRTDAESNFLLAGDDGAFIRADRNGLRVDTNMAAVNTDNPLLGDSLSVRIDQLAFPAPDPQLLLYATNKDDSDLAGFSGKLYLSGLANGKWASWAKSEFPQREKLLFHLTAGNGWEMYTKTDTVVVGPGLMATLVKYLKWDKPFSNEIIAPNLAVALILYIIVALALFFASPVGFVRLNNGMMKLLPKKVIQALPLLINRPRIVRTFIKKSARTDLQEPLSDWIPQPALVNGEKHAELNEIIIQAKLDEIVSGNGHCHIHISGAAETGKTAFLRFLIKFVCQQAEDNKRPLLPIYIADLAAPLDDEVARKIRDGSPYPRISTIISPTLMGKGYAVAIVDGISEMRSFKPEFLGGKSGARATSLLITTSRAKMAGQPTLNIHLLGQPLPVLNLEALGAYLNPVPADGDPEVLALLAAWLKTVLPASESSLSDETWISGGLVFTAIRFLRQEKRGKDEEVPSYLRRIGILTFEAYLSSIMDKTSQKEQLLRQLRMAAYCCIGLHLLPDGNGLSLKSRLPNLDRVSEDKDVIHSDKISLELLKKNIDDFQQEALEASGVILLSGPADDVILSFPIASLKEYLAARELLIQVRDGQKPKAFLDYIRGNFPPNRRSFIEELGMLETMKLAH